MFHKVDVKNRLPDAANRPGMTAGAVLIPVAVLRTRAV